VSSMFSKEIGHKSQGNFSFDFWAELFFCCGRPYYTDLYSLYNFIQFVLPYRFGMEIEAVLGTVFKVDFKLMFIVSKPYGTFCTANC
jgi:hypothetical protein